MVGWWALGQIIGSLLGLMLHSWHWGDLMVVKDVLEEHETS
jgi:hypothetical protein